ncbi:radial spoke head protein 3 homolog B-like [Boleophthalmus pectinirostris]|uniref:radial spoke head protein 3 homolog B-like n=1 Tax=Boleophthalmus pectinirostris TaxID=150288 RepID=UPI00242CFAA5|nr:radial spoke head protein 3 homolog B-like [Boleophthalmus pectinirostris]
MAFVSQRETSDTYTFSSRPRVVENRSRYREAPPEQPHYGNIMYDRRVVRGNTYAQRILPTTTQAELAEMQRLQEQRRKAVARRRARDQVRVRTPEPLQGRQHTDVQTGTQHYSNLHQRRSGDLPRFHCLVSICSNQKSNICIYLRQLYTMQM